MASENQIVNFALMLLGQSPIVLGEKSVNATYVEVAYNLTRKSFLQLHNWNDATKRTKLTIPDESGPEWEFSYQFNLPADFLSLVSIYPFTRKRTFPGDMDGCAYRIEGRKILTNLSSVMMLYIYDMENTQSWSPIMSKAFSANLAMELTGKIPGTKSKLEEVSARFKAYLDAAIDTNAQNSLTVNDSNNWLISRNRRLGGTIYPAE